MSRLALLCAFVAATMLSVGRTDVGRTELRSAAADHKSVRPTYARTELRSAAADHKSVRPTDAQAGTAVVAGVVVEADPQAQAVGRAIVTLSGTELPRGRTAITDDAGRFVFDSLPAGRFMVSVTKAAYLAGAYGATRPGRPTIAVCIAYTV